MPDVAALGQLEHLLLVDAGHAREVEVGQLLEHRKAGRLDEPDLAIALALGHLLLGQREQVAVEAQVGLRRIFGELAVVAQEARQAELLEIALQEQVGFHAHLPATSNCS